MAAPSPGSKALPNSRCVNWMTPLGSGPTNSSSSKALLLSCPDPLFRDCTTGRTGFSTHSSSSPEELLDSEEDTFFFFFNFLPLSFECFFFFSFLSFFRFFLDDFLERFFLRPLSESLLSDSDVSFCFFAFGSSSSARDSGLRKQH